MRYFGAPAVNPVLTIHGFPHPMPNYRRARVPGATYFFTVALAERGGRLLVENIALLREAFRTTRRDRPFRIDAMVVLPDHLHAVWSLPQGDTDFSTRWGAIKGRFSRSVREAGLNRRAGFTPPRIWTGRNGGVNPALRTAKGEAGVWQRRFWEHLIRDDTDLRNHVDYCHFNPVKHGLVTNAADWPYSTFHRYVRAGKYPREWAADFSATADFGE